MQNPNKNSSGEAGPKTGPLPSLHPLPGSVLAVVLADWGRWERPLRQVQLGLLIHAETPEEIAYELEYMAYRIRQKEYTEGTSGGRKMNMAWSIRFSPQNAEHTNGEQRQP